MSDNMMPAPALLEAIASVDNLTRAWQKVRRNIRVAQRGRSRGTDEMTIAAFEADWAQQMEILAAELRTGQYHPLPPRPFFLPKDDGSRRAIAILAVRDRVAQRAAQQVLEPIFDPGFLDCSWGCRPHVGAPHALARIARYQQQGLIWAAHGDIASFFDNIDHRILLGLVRRQVKERAVLELIAEWLHAGVMGPAAESEAGMWWERGETVLEQAIDWSMDEMVRRIDPLAAYTFDDGDDLGPILPEERAPEARPTQRRQRAVRGLTGHAALLALSYAKPMLGAARQAAPMLWRLRAHPAVLGTMGVAAAAATAPVVWQRLRRGGPRGTIQGGALSPLLANVYLDPFDRALTRRGHTLVRYVDDFLLLGTSRETVETALAEAQRHLGRLRLELNAAKTVIYPPEKGLEFLGHTFPPVVAPAGPRWPSFEAAEQALRAAKTHGRQAARRVPRPGKKAKADRS
jgi:RNA-directed DNA polymerase